MIRTTRWMSLYQMDGLAHSTACVVLLENSKTRQLVSLFFLTKLLILYLHIRFPMMILIDSSPCSNESAIIAFLQTKEIPCI